MSTRQRAAAESTGYTRMFNRYGTLYGMDFDKVFESWVLLELEQRFGPFSPGRYERPPFLVVDLPDGDGYSDLPDLFMREHLESLERLKPPDVWEGICP